MAKRKFSRDLAQSAKVKNLAAMGIRPGLIAKRLGISLSQLEQNFGRELETAALELKAFVGATLFRKAISGEVTAQIFWLKTRAGWSETVRREISGPQGAPIAVTVANTSVLVVFRENVAGAET